MNFEILYAEIEAYFPALMSGSEHTCVDRRLLEA